MTLEEPPSPERSMSRPQDSVGMAVGVGVTLCPYNELWPLEFERVRGELKDAFSDSLVSINHVGSTAVPGLVAKPIIDILVGIADLEKSLELVPAFEALGFVFRPDDDLPDRHYLPRTVDGLRCHHVSMAEPSSRHFQNTLVFREALRGNPDLANRYATLKRELADSAGAKRLEYLNGKTDFILDVLWGHGGEIGGDYPMRNLGSRPEQ